MRPLLLIAAFAVLACDSVSAKDAPKGDKPKRPPAPVALSEVKTGPISAYYVATATLEPQKTASVLARVAGLVERIQHEEGDLVKENAVLLRIDNDEYRLKVAQAEAETQRLADQVKLLQKLVAKDLAPAEELATTKQQLAAAKAAEDIARLELSRTTVRAPFAGRLTSRAVDVGRTVSNGTPLFDIVDLTPLIARVYVPAKELKRLKQGQAVKLVVDSDKTELIGKIFLVSPVIDPTSGTVKVSIEIPEYPEGTRAGDFAEVRIVTERRDTATLVPRIAIVEERQDRVVYVAKGDAVERRVLEIGFEEDDVIEAKKGVAAGEKVVVKGQHSLEDGAPIKVLEG
ncbi:MAG: efflux RND transporter periplasmic adaptor subunit [Deltaproteobacteria bacterium]|jgi:membrane fusion protein (multidrug efflux system)